MTEKNDTFEKLLAYCRSEGRVCPMPQRWAELDGMLPNKRSTASGREPPLPLILAAWDASDWAKADRLALHIQWAQQNGAIESVNKFLRGLPENKWHHAGD